MSNGAVALAPWELDHGGLHVGEDAEERVDRLDALHLEEDAERRHLRVHDRDGGVELVVPGHRCDAVRCGLGVPCDHQEHALALEHLGRVLLERAEEAAAVLVRYPEDEDEFGMEWETGGDEEELD